MGIEVLEKITNTYERKARLYPAFLLLLPIVMLVVGVYGVALDRNTTVVGMLATFGVFYLAASIVRERGTKLEKSLFREWGGKPTTQLLRHRNTGIDPITKDRYHTFLSRHLGTIFPTKYSEATDPVAADDVYESATKWLLDKTRDKKVFELLFEELIAYGFRRNCLGIKPFAIIVSLGAFIWPLVVNGVLTIRGINVNPFDSFSTRVWGSIVISLCMFFVWVFFVTRNTVKTAAFRYAHRLLSSCDVLSEIERLQH